MYRKTKKIKTVALYKTINKNFLLILLATKHVEFNMSDITIMKHIEIKLVICLYTTCLSLERAIY